MKKKILSIIVLFVVFVSCSENGDLSTRKVLSIDRVEFLSENSDLSKLKEFYRSLSFESQKDLWIGKIYQTQGTKFGCKNIGILNSILKILNKANNREDLVLNPELKKIAITAAKSFPTDVFIQVFCSLDDFFDLNHKDGIYIEDFAELIKEDFDQVKFYEEFQKSGNLPPCNCKWTCAMFELVACTHDKCQPKSTGCGFLWLFDCTKRDEIHEQDCPPGAI
jgi:hypothetical protein